MSARVFTASWAMLRDADRAGLLTVQPVRISRGTPKFWPQAAAFPAVEALMPDGWMLGIKDTEKFWRSYRRKLHTTGLPAMQAQLDELAAAADRPLALACFEKAPADCHRGPHGFAGWYERQTGEAVPDLSLLRGPAGLALVYEVGQAELSNVGRPAQPQVALAPGAERT